jgi:hypothetical protein
VSGDSLVAAVRAEELAANNLNAFTQHAQITTYHVYGRKYFIQTTPDTDIVISYDLIGLTLLTADCCAFFGSLS